MRLSTLLILALGVIVVAAYAQTPPPNGDPNEVWLDVTYSGKQSGKIAPDADFTLDVHIANDQTLAAQTNCLRLWSPDGVTWSYRTSMAWFGSQAGTRGDLRPSISVSGRWIGAYDDPQYFLLLPNPLLGGSAGTADDSILVSGVALFSPGLPAGPLENLVQLNMTMGSVEGTWCVDSAFFPPAGPWVFSNAQGTQIIPSFAGPFCWSVEELPYVCGDASGNGEVNIADAVYLVSWIFKGGPAPPNLEAADENCDGTNSVADVAYLVAWIVRGGPAPCCP
jgi:hypothetical protein